MSDGRKQQGKLWRLAADSRERQAGQRRTSSDSCQQNKLLEIFCHAHIKVKIITGDNAITAKAVGQSIGLTVTGVITGDQIDKMNDRELKKAIYENQIFARTKPEHKYRSHQP